MGENCKNFNPNLLISNFSETKFYIDDIIEDNKAGSVIHLINSIHCDIHDFRATNHELLHLSTLTSINICGFREISIEKDYVKGRGINEGYTQLLLERYFH